LTPETEQLDFICLLIEQWVGPPQTGTGDMSIQQQQEQQQQQQQQQEEQQEKRQQQPKRRNRSDGQVADGSTVSKKQ
jgi:hypothetical protein